MFLGEKLEDEQVNEVFADCLDPEDDDGNIFYARKYRTATVVLGKLPAHHLPQSPTQTLFSLILSNAQSPVVQIPTPKKDHFVRLMLVA